MHIRKFLMGLETVLGLRRRGFFIPYRYAHTMPGAGEIPHYPAALAALEARRAAQGEVIRLIDKYAVDLEAIGGGGGGGDGQSAPQPKWTQDWFPRLDAAAAYALVRESKPQRIVETGSGHSTRFLARAVADEGCATAITAIDPAPRAAIDNLGIEIIRATLAQAGDGPYAKLQSGDILFVDSSHILMPGSDVDDLINRILPRLPQGVLVHIHDMFLPDDYPASWAWRGYNEQSAVLPLITGGGYEIVFSSHFVVRHMPDSLAETVLNRLPKPEGAFETSLWLRKRI